MTLKEFLELNMSITDLYLVVREGGSALKDFLAIGLDAGVKPPHPIVIDRGHAGQKEGQYIRKSINAWDDDADYWQLKINRIPSKWLELEVYSFHQRYVYKWHHPRSERNPADGYEAYEITLLPSGESLEIVDKKNQKTKNEKSEGQISIFDLEGINGK